MTTYTINTIRDEMQASGSHWWDRDTMRFFRCRVSEQVYQGPGGIYFVTSEKYSDESGRLYSVRKYDPQTKQVDTIGDFNSLTRQAAHKQAAELAGSGAIVAAEVYQPISAVAQLALDIARGGGEATEADAGILMRLARKHLQMMEDYCNIPACDVYESDYTPTPRHAKLLAQIEAAAKRCGCGVVFSGDPRGATVKLTLPNGQANDWGKEGWIVPTGN